MLLWDGQNGKFIRRIGNRSTLGYIDMFLLSPDGKFLMTAKWGGRHRNSSIRHIYKISATDCQLTNIIRHDHIPSGRTAIAPDGRTAATGCLADNAIRVWDIQTGKIIKTLGEKFPSNKLLWAYADKYHTQAQTADGYVDLSENQTLSQMRRAAIADAKRNILVSTQKSVSKNSVERSEAEAVEKIWTGREGIIRVLA